MSSELSSHLPSVSVSAPSGSTPPSAAAPAKAAESVQAAGHTISTQPCPGFEEVNALAVQSFTVREREGGHIEVFHASVTPPKLAETEKVKLLMTPNEKKDAKFDQKVKQLYEQLTQGLKVGSEGTLVHEDGHNLGIKPEELVAVIRGSLKTKDAAPKYFNLLRSSGDKDNATILRLENKEHFVSFSKSFASGGAGTIYKAYDHLAKEIQIVKQAELEEPHNKSAIEKERDNLNYVNPDNKPGIMHKCFYAYRFVTGGLNKVGIIIRNYSQGDYTKFVKNTNPSVAQKLQNLLQICNGISILDEKQVAHLDIKPGNIFVDSESKACVADFDGVLRMDKDSILETATIISKNQHSFSLDSLHGDDDKLLRMISKSVVATHSELERLKEQKKGIKNKDMHPQIDQAIKNAQDNYDKASLQLHTMVQAIHTYEVAFMAYMLLSVNMTENPTSRDRIDFDALMKKSPEEKLQEMEGSINKLDPEDRIKFRAIMLKALTPTVFKEGASIDDMIPRRLKASTMAFHLMDIVGRAVSKSRTLNPIEKAKTVRIKIPERRQGVRMSEPPLHTEELEPKAKIDTEKPRTASLDRKKG